MKNENKRAKEEESVHFIYLSSFFCAFAFFSSFILTIHLISRDSCVLSSFFTFGLIRPSFHYN